MGAAERGQRALLRVSLREGRGRDEDAEGGWRGRGRHRAQVWPSGFVGDGFVKLLFNADAVEPQTPPPAFAPPGFKFDPANQYPDVNGNRPPTPRPPTQHPEDSPVAVSTLDRSPPPPAWADTARLKDAGNTPGPA